MWCGFARDVAEVVAVWWWAGLGGFGGGGYVFFCDALSGGALM